VPEERVARTRDGDDVIDVLGAKRVGRGAAAFALTPGALLQEGLGVGTPATVVTALCSAATGAVVGFAGGGNAAYDVGVTVAGGLGGHDAEPPITGFTGFLT